MEERVLEVGVPYEALADEDLLGLLDMFEDRDELEVQRQWDSTLAEMAVRFPKFTVALSHSSLAGSHIPCCWAHGRLWSAPTSSRRKSKGSPGTLNPWHRSIDCC